MTSMMKLRKRFVQHPLVPNVVIEQQNKWRERWGLQPRTAQPGEDWSFYLDPAPPDKADANDPRRRLRYTLCADTDRNTKYFLTGSKGAGKSTTAYSLYHDDKISARYTLISFTIRDYLNLADTDASQVIAVMIAHLVERIRDEGGDATLGQLQGDTAVKELSAVLAKVRPSAKLAQANVSVFGWFTAVFKESASARESFRKYIDGRFDAVMAVFDELNGILEASTSKPTLFIVDDLDKLPIGDVSRKVFQIQLPMLLRPSCAALYSYPIEVDHDPEFDGLKRGQPNRYLLANVKLAETPDGPMRAEGREVLTDFVRKRLGGHELGDAVELSEAAWDRVLHYSAGNFRELSRILGHAFEIAAMEERVTADKHCFELALKRLRTDYNMFVQQYRGFLSQLQRPRLETSVGLAPDLLMRLLAAFAVVEFPNEPGWLGLNPVVEDLLEGRPSSLPD